MGTGILIVCTLPAALLGSCIPRVASVVFSSRGWLCRVVKIIMPRSSGPKVSVESVEEMIELVRQNSSLYGPASPDHMDSVVSANIWKSIAEKLLPSNPDMTGIYISLLFTQARPLGCFLRTPLRMHGDTHYGPGPGLVYVYGYVYVYGCMET